MNQGLAGKPRLTAEYPTQNSDCAYGRYREMPGYDASGHKKQSAQKNQNCRCLSNASGPQTDEKVLINGRKAAELLHERINAIVS